MYYSTNFIGNYEFYVIETITQDDPNTEWIVEEYYYKPIAKCKIKKKHENHEFNMQIKAIAKNVTHDDLVGKKVILRQHGFMVIDDFMRAMKL